MKDSHSSLQPYTRKAWGFFAFIPKKNYPYILTKVDVKIRNKKCNTKTDKKYTCTLSPEFSIELSDFFLIPETTVDLYLQRVLRFITSMTRVLAVLYYLSPLCGGLMYNLLTFERFIISLNICFSVSVTKCAWLFSGRLWSAWCFCCCHMEKLVR